MTIEQLQEIINKPNTNEAVYLLTQSDLNLPSWANDLEPQYNEMKHAIMVDALRYPVKMQNGVDQIRRIPLAKQKEAVNKMAQSLFYTDVVRKYDIENDDEQAEEAKEALEINYKVLNAVDSLNMERGKELFKSCQVATVWRLEKKRTTIKGKTSEFALTHNLYSPALGYKLYPYFSDEKRLLGLSIGWTDARDATMKLITYVVGAVITYENTGGGWKQLDIEQNDLDVLPVIYTWIDEPVWGGKGGTALVEIMEDILSKQMMYIDKNTVPTYVIYKGEGGRVSKVEEKPDDSRRVIVVEKGGFMNAVQWEGAKDAVEWQYRTIEEQFYQQTQVFNNSPSAMQKTPLSADNKEILLFDSKARAKDYGGEYVYMLTEEFDLVKKLMAVQFPVWANQLEMLNCRSIITPYSVRSLKDRAESIKIARDAGVISIEQGVEELDVADNVSNEVELIMNERNQEINNLL